LIAATSRAMRIELALRESSIGIEDRSVNAKVVAAS
jgi:hypothetical protein